LTANGVFSTSAAVSPIVGRFAALEKSTFVGAGPRFGLQGEIPLGGQWSIDWLAGAAVLFGERSLQEPVTATIVSGPGAGTTIAVARLASDSPAVFNVDAQAGLSYWISPIMKITASYRFDGYFNALKTFNSAGNTVNVDRLYNGPMVRLTSKF
jgi:Legionella pneumophila major outer membrane protein precursor